MLIGAHVSIAGGIQNAPLNAAKIGCEVFQMFTRSPQGGAAQKLIPEAIEAFRQNCKENRLKQWVIHTPYYINFANETERIRKNSSRIVREELERGTMLGAQYVMFHPGSASGVGQKHAMKHVIDGIKHIYDKYAGTTELLIEISAGAGMVIGDTFEAIAEILDGVGHPDLGVCFDTQHAFASGYDLRDERAVHETFKKFDGVIGLKKLKMSHCNDSKVELGARRDRHEHIGDGFIGMNGFRAIVHHPKLKHVNLFLETEPDKVEEDLKTLKKLRGC
ncbi:MAG TPA: deoxyribonuclease IV [Patescibacteria group bacterium]|nr:deoxyribonuclease IV [Patescibacteria group bacterium]